MTDAQLLAEFAGAQSPDAFAALVRRYAGLVYGTARRMVGDGHTTDDVTQAAFIVLAKKAKTVNPSTLPGWLVNTTRLAAKEAMRSKLCQERHENRAAMMRSEIQYPPDEPTADDLAPLLDEALSQLNEMDRSAVVMRFLQGRTFAEVGAAMETGEEAARKRVIRAIEKLRTIFIKQGFMPSVGGVMLALASQQAARAPAALINSILAATGVSGTGTSSILAKGVISAMRISKFKLAVVLLLLLAFISLVGVAIKVMHPALVELPVTTPASPTFRATFKDGVGVELLGVGERIDSDDQWWNANGTESSGMAEDVQVPLQPSPLARDQDEAFKGFAVMLTSTAADTELPNVRAIDEWGNVKSHPFMLGNPEWKTVGTAHQADRGRYEILLTQSPFFISSNDPTTFMRYELATGPWQTRFEVPAKEFGNKIDKFVDQFHVTIVEDTPRGVQVTLEYPFFQRSFMEVAQVVLTCEAGTVIAGEVHGVGPSTFPKCALTIYRFAGKHLSDVKSVIVQTRRYNRWVEFRNLALHPGTNTNVRIVTSDG